MGPRTRILLLACTLAAFTASCADRREATPTAPSDSAGTARTPATPVGPQLDLGGSAHLNITSKILDFGDIQTGVVSPQQIVNITNLGSAPIVMSGAGGAPPGNFSGVQDCQGLTLAVGATCHMFFTFTPAGPGPDSSASIGSWNGQGFSIKLRGNGVAPQLLIKTAAIDFGYVPTGTTSPQQIVSITNVGKASVVMSGAGGAPPGNFSGVQDCQGLTLAVGATCHMFFTFTPAAAGPDSSRSIGSWNGQGFNIPMRGIGLAPALRITPAALDFGEVLVNTVSRSDTVNITNTGTTNLVMSGAGGAPPGNFSGVQDCQGQTLAPGATCHMYFTFNPTAAGADSSRSIGTWNGQGFNIPMKGTGITGSGTQLFLIKTAAIDYGDVRVGLTSPQQTVSITNVSGSPIVMSGAGGAPPGHFSGVQDCQGQTLQPGAACHMFFTFSPVGAGPDSSASIGSWNGQNFNIKMRGNGYDPRFRITPSALNYGDVQTGTVSRSDTVFITNQDASSIVMSGAGGAPPGNFSGVQDCQGQTLATGATCRMFFTFNPASPGPDSSRSIGSWNNVGFNIPMHGNGVPPKFQITPAGFDFGQVNVSTTSLQVTANVTNIGLSSVVMSGAGGAPPGNFNGVQDCQGLTLAVGATCHIFYTFHPAFAGPDSSRSIGSWNNQGFDIPMQGIGVGPQQAMDLAPATISLGSTIVTSAVLLSSPTFDATTVTLTSVRMLVNQTNDVAPIMRAGVVVSSVRDWNGDGHPDRMFSFQTSALVAAGLTTTVTPTTLILHGTQGASTWQAADNGPPTFVP
jgi:hypothetical protein